jgi:hypothetical protein
MNRKSLVIGILVTITVLALLVPMQYVSATHLPNGLRWGIVGNGFRGDLVLSYNSSGDLSGTAFGDRIIGFYDGRTEKILFMRISNPAIPSTFQVYTGYYFEDRTGPGPSRATITGTFVTPAGAGGSAERNEFGWHAQTTP